MRNIDEWIDRVSIYAQRIRENGQQVGREKLMLFLGTYKTKALPFPCKR